MSTSFEKGCGRTLPPRLLRVALGVMYLTHSIVLKLFTFGLAGTAGYFASIGLPARLAYVVFAAEAVGGMLLLANVATAWVALALLPVLGGALWVHSGNGWVFSAPGGGWEYPVVPDRRLAGGRAAGLRGAQRRRAPQPARLGSVGTSGVKSAACPMPSCSHRRARVRELPAGLSARTVRVARARRARARRGVGLWLRQRPGEHRPGRTFRRYIATDVAPEQIAAARPHPRVRYRLRRRRSRGWTMNRWTW